MSDAIADNLARIQARIAAAIERRGPGPQVRLIGVGKKQPLEKLLAAYQAGLRDFGENYAQELRDKLRDWPLEHPRWHYIGALQSNKLKYIVGKVALIHTVDRVELLEAIDQRAHKANVTQELLLEVDLADEPQKAGARPDEVPALLDACAAGSGHVRCVGLMCIPPVEDPEASRRWFAALRELRDRLAAEPREHVELRELSMGMSADYEQAIEEGATLVRVGTALFGARA